jgi:hypothetical protein
MALTAVRARTKAIASPVWSLEPAVSLVAVAVSLLVLHAAVFLIRAGQLGLYVDDWGYLQAVTTHSAVDLFTTFPMDYRPLEVLPWLVLVRAFGTHLVAYYAVFFALRYGTSMLFYLFARRLTGNSIVAVGCAVLWSVYPSDTSVLWLTSFAYRFGTAFILASATLLLVARSSRARTPYWAAVLCCVLCLLSNELFLGLCASLPVLAWWQSTSTLWRRAWRAVPFAVAICAYLLYREWAGPHLFHFIDPKPTGLTFNPGQLALRVLQGGFVQLLGGWMAAAVGFTGSNPRVLVAVVCVVVWLCGLAGVLMFRDLSHPASRSHRDREAFIPPGPRLILFGLVIMVVGYIPLVLTGVPPALGEVASRVNAAASIGAVIFFVGIAWVLACRPGLRPEASRAWFTAVLVVLTLGGIAVQEHAAGTSVSAWASQRAFWRSTLGLTSSVRPNSTIVILAPEVRVWDTVQSLPPSSFKAAFDLMYPESKVDGIVLLQQEIQACGGMGLLENGVVRGVELQQHGFRYLDSGVFVPYRRVVVLTYFRSGQPMVRSAPRRRRLNAQCQIESNPTLLRGHTLIPSPWKQLVVTGT